MGRVIAGMRRPDLTNPPKKKTFPAPDPLSALISA
jgi:hypothetical protein